MPAPDYDKHLREQAAWLLAMRRNPATKDHAELRVGQLMALDPMYEALPDLIRELRSASTSPCASAKGKTTASTGEQRPGK